LPLRKFETPGRLTPMIFAAWVTDIRLRMSIVSRTCCPGWMGAAMRYRLVC
jgi:hypothetical protein